MALLLLNIFKIWGQDVIVVDNLSTGNRDSIDVDAFYPIDIREKDKLDKVFKNHKIDAVIHFSEMIIQH